MKLNLIRKVPSRLCKVQTFKVQKLYCDCYYGRVKSIPGSYTFTKTSY